MEAARAKLNKLLDTPLPGSEGALLQSMSETPSSLGITVSKRVYVGNMAYSVSWQDLKDHFRQAGNVVHAKVLESEPGAKGTSKGCGIVEFSTQEEAARAITLLHDVELKGRKLFVREDREDVDLKGAGGGKSRGKQSFAGTAVFSDAKRPRTTGVFSSALAPGSGGTRRCYVGNLSYRTSWQDLKDHFKPIGAVVHTSIMEERPGYSKGCGIVEFERAEDAAKAIKELTDTELDGRLIYVREDREDKELTGGKGGAAGKGGGGAGKGREAAKGGKGGPFSVASALAASSGSRRVYIGNLSYRTSWQDLKDHFRSVGQVVYSNVMETTPGHSKGCGIVEFARAEEAAAAIQKLNDSVLDDRLIWVREDREDREMR